MRGHPAGTTVVQEPDLKMKAAVLAVGLGLVTGSLLHRSIGNDWGETMVDTGWGVRLYIGLIIFGTLRLHSKTLHAFLRSFD